jgi:hypothetical protein
MRLPATADFILSLAYLLLNEQLQANAACIALHQYLGSIASLRPIRCHVVCYEGDCSHRVKRPYTFVVLAILIALFGGIAVWHTPTGMFPSYPYPLGRCGDSVFQFPNHGWLQSVRGICGRRMRMSVSACRERTPPASTTSSRCEVRDRSRVTSLRSFNE